MYPSKRKCNDVDVAYPSANAGRPITERSKSAELLTDNGEYKMRIYTFIDQDYGEALPPVDTNKTPQAATKQRPYKYPKRRLNRKEGSLNVDDDATFPKECYCNPQSRYVPRYARRTGPPNNTSPVWQSTPSIPTLYTSTYCRHSDASNCRLEAFNNVDTHNEYECLNATNDRLQHGGCIQNRVARERSKPVLVGGRGNNNIIDPLSTGNIMSPEIHNRQTHRCLVPFSCDNYDGHNMNEIVIEQSRPRYLDLQGSAIGRSVETLDVCNDLIQHEPETGQRLLQTGDESNKVKTSDSTCRGCVSTYCPAIRCTSYQKRFYIVLVLNLILVLMNILGIPVAIRCIGRGVGGDPGEVAAASRLDHRCINCSQLNPFCDIKSLGLVREGEDHCCFNSSEDSSFTTMIKAVDVYLDCRLSGQQDNFQLPVIQYSVENGRSINQENRIIWKEHADVPPQGFGSLKYGNSLIMINKPGHYYIYTKVMYKKQSSAHAPVGYSLMKENFKKFNKTVIDYVNEHCFTESTPQYTEHGSQLITVHKFGESEGVYVKLNTTVNFDKYSEETKILIFYMNLERKHKNETKIADLIPLS